MIGRYVVASVVAGLALVVVCSTAATVLANAKDSSPSGVTVQMLAQTSVPKLPAGKVFISILEFSQVPGAACGPACGLPSFVYTIHGVATISSPGATTRSVSPGNAAFTAPSAVITNDTIEGRISAGAIAVSLIVIGILLCAAKWLRGGRRRTVVPLLSVLLIAAGALGVSGATSNDWYLFTIRPYPQYSQPMPRPDGKVDFLSPVVDPLPAAPYTETLSAITVPAGARYDVPGVPGPEMVIVVEGTATVHIGGATQQLSSGGGGFAQLGQTLAIVNSGTDPLKVLDFAVTSAGTS